MMATALISGVFSVVGKALAPLKDGLLKDWAASVELGDNVEALELELLSAKAVLEHTVGKEIADNSAFRELLVRLQDLGYDADDVLDELDYFRIQDQLHGTSAAADRHAKGFIHNMALHAKAVGKQFICLPTCFSPNTKVSHNCQEVNTTTSYTAVIIGKCFPCSSQPSAGDDDNRGIDTSVQTINHRNDEPPELIFNRIEASKRMQHIVKQLQLVQQKVSVIIAALGPSWSTAPNIAQSRQITTSDPTEPKLYGRDLMMSSIIHDITEGKHSGDLLTVIPIVGPGGIGKTTLAKHIYHNEKVQNHFDIKVWKCVSLKFNANNLIEEIEKHIPQINGENSTSTAGQLIAQRLKDKRFLLVLDDIWDCSEPGWQQLLVPFKKSQVHGNIIIVTSRRPAQAQIMIQNIDHPLALQGLEHDEFMKLFVAVVFGNYQHGEIHTFFIQTGDAIARKLKGSPLAAKTVGRLLKTQLDRGHWTRVLESKEWEHSNSENDIMPALKLSYDYLPSKLQRCFSYCGLFPQDYIFKQEELITFWIGLDVLHLSPGENTRVEDIGLSNLRELVNHGFFEKAREKKNGSSGYILHDLLHELAQKVSSHECLSINSSEAQVSSLKVLPSIRHLSININNTSVKDRFTLKNCGEDFSALDKRLRVEKLRTLMLFGKHHSCLVKFFGDLFRESKALRVVFLSEPSYDVKDMLHSFYKLIHLRYLRIQCSDFPDQIIVPLPVKLSRFYHMMILEVRKYPISVKNMSNLVKLRHFLVDSYSSIAEVGKLKSLQELRIFNVKHERQGFELSQIGELVQLCGSFCINGLENVQVEEEADEAKLIQKIHLQELILCWDNFQSTNNGSAIEELVLARLKPSSNLQNLSISGNRGDICPSWLGTSLSVKNLESLFLNGVAWKTFPPIGQLGLVNVSGEEIPSIMPEKRFENLRQLVLMELPQLKRWVVHAPCQWFPFLEVLDISFCSNLVELSFSHSACCHQEKLANRNLFPNKLSLLKIVFCPQLSSFPTALPWTNEATCCIDIKHIGSPYLEKLAYGKENFHPEYSLTIEGKDHPDSTFWNVLAFHNLTKLKEFRMSGWQHLPLHHMQMLSSLRKLSMSCSSSTFPFVDGGSYFKYQVPVEELKIDQWSGSGKALTQLLTCFPKLSDMRLWHCEKITRLRVMGPQTTAAPGPSSSSANKLEEDGMLILPPQLQVLWISGCPELSLFSDPHDDSKNDGRTGGGGLQGMRSLRELGISNCPNFLSSYSTLPFYSCFPFPNSLEDLSLYTVGVEMLVPLPLSNLSSLTRLSIYGCGDLIGEGLLSLLVHGCLTKLIVIGTPNFFVDSYPSRVHEQELPPCSSKPQFFSTDDVAGVTAAPICRLLVSSLTKLRFSDMVVECFTEEQEILLFVNSLEEITFDSCNNLLCLPERLHRLPNLKRLEIYGCKAIQVLPKDSLPSSLQELEIKDCQEIRSLPEDGLPSSLQQICIEDCPDIQSMPEDGLPSSLQRLRIKRCSAIQSLPKVDDLPSTLRELDIKDCGNEELKRQCRRLIGIIPIVRA
ncbi:hypothetical protein HU200_061054 [Digitaria exilis]|uniref:AAA+ ATPase domain-containing protein n=1 Tax=Digitaria exilis TaxID=1010633 RepID=A0A835DWV5_9POAL|nr:hypothetical protein HU200_061054 [Digitaria exilis]